MLGLRPRRRRRAPRSSRDTGDACPATARKRQPLDGPRQQLVGRRCPRRWPSRSRRHAASTRSRTSADASPAPPRAHRRAAAAPRGRGRTGRAARARACRGSAATRSGVQEHCAAPIAARTTGTQVHRGDELEARREDGAPGRRGRPRRPVLERLPQRLERRPLELGQLVEEEDAAVREARLAGSRHPAPAADERRDRGRVVRRAERRHATSPAPGGSDAGYRVDARHLERRVVGEQRQDPRQPAREHRLSRARRAGEQQVVPTRGGDLERAPRALVAAHLGEVGDAGERLEVVGRQRRIGGSRSPRRYATASAR